MAKSNTTLATPEQVKPVITRSELRKLVKEKQVERYQLAKSEQQAKQRDFIAHVGRVDRIDETFLRDLQNLQVRAAAITAKQKGDRSYGPEPKTAKFVEQLGTMIGTVSAYLATERAIELFTPINEREYVQDSPSGYESQAIQERYRSVEAEVLEQYDVKNDVPAPTVIQEDDEGSELCGHEETMPFASLAMTEADQINENDASDDRTEVAAECCYCDQKFVKRDGEYTPVTEAELEALREQEAVAA